MLWWSSFLTNSSHYFQYNVCMVAWNWTNVDARYNSFLIRFYCGFFFLSLSLALYLFQLRRFCTTFFGHCQIKPNNLTHTRNKQPKMKRDEEKKNNHSKTRKRRHEVNRDSEWIHQQFSEVPNILFKHEMKISLKTSDLWKTENVTMLQKDERK